MRPLLTQPQLRESGGRFSISREAIMAIPPEAILFAIKALSQLGSSARKAYEDAVVGQEVILPGLQLQPMDASEKAALYFDDALLQSELDLPAYRLEEIRTDVDRVIHNVGTEQERFLSGRNLVRLAARHFPDVSLPTEIENGIWLVQQWAPGGRPMTAAERVGLALIEVGLEYVAVHPGAIGVGANAEKLIAGVAENVLALLPEPESDKSFKNDFAERSIKIFVQAGLMALEQHPDIFVEKESLQKLSGAVLKPLIESVSKDSSGTRKWYDIQDELLGPISEAAIGVIAENQSALLGESFETHKALGAVTQSVLLAVKEKGIQDDFGRQGLIRIYKAALDVAVNQPGLFIGEIGGKDIGQELLKEAAALIRETSPPFNCTLATELTATTIECIGRNAPTLFVYNRDWGKLSTAAARTVIKEVAAGLAAGVRNENADIVGRLFNKEQANRFFTLLVDQAAANPGMIVGSDAAPELKVLTAIIARTMSEQSTQLLSSQDWLSVAAAVAKEVARNPQRLIKIDERVPESQLAYKVISKVLQAAADNFTTVGRKGGCILFGTTLAEVIDDSLEAAAGNAARAMKNTHALEALIERLNTVIANRPGVMGRREWRYLFRHFIADVLDTGQVPDYTDDQLLEPLRVT
jgi:hypothetical protein